jgi:3-methylcrotonyl-CoA carboxylase beta subunit
MVGTRSEHGRHHQRWGKNGECGFELYRSQDNHHYGQLLWSRNYAMCGKAYDPRLIAAWPTAKIAVMGGEQAAKVLTQIQVASLKGKGQEPKPDEEKELFEKIKNRYDEQTTPYYAAARLWVDAIINPLETRRFISMGIEAANNAPLEKFNVGVFQV